MKFMARSVRLTKPFRTMQARSPFVCQSCLSRRRFYSSAEQPGRLGTVVPAAPPSPPPAAGFAALASRRLISLSGPDVAKYLQGAVTANILTPDKRPRRTGFYAAFLHAQGRVLYDVFIYPDTLTEKGYAAGPGNSFLIEVDAAEAARLASHIKRYKLRAKFDVRLLDVQEATVWHAWDDAGQAGLGDASNPPNNDNMRSHIIGPVCDLRSPTLGSRIITLGGSSSTADANPAALLKLDLAREPETSYRIRRYLHGVAEGQSEILREQALPQESNMDLAGAIDFRKGCYLGQELTIRTRHRGVVRKRILPCVLYGEDQPTPPGRLEYLPRSGEQQPPTAESIPMGTSIGRVGKRGRSAGKWLNGVGNIGLALCRLEIMTDLELPGETAAAAYSPADEFMMVTGLDEDGDGGASGKAVKIKAFVPDWLRAGLVSQGH